MRPQVNEAEELPEGHAGDVSAADRAVDVLLDQEADESFGTSSADLAETHLDEYPEEVWEDEADSATGAQAS